MKKKRDYDISSSVNGRIFEMVLTGNVTEDLVETLQNEVLAAAKASGTMLLLIDVRSLKGRFGFEEAFHRVRNYPLDRPRKRHTAVVDITENAEFQSFHETTGLNAGLSMKWFTDIEAARAWLLSQQK